MAESVNNVAREVEKVVSKFSSLNEHTQSTLNDLIDQVQNLLRDLACLTGKQSVDICVKTKRLSNDYSSLFLL